MSTLQPLYDVKDRLEAAAMANEEKIAELEWFRQAAQAKRLRTFVTWSEERVQQAIDNLKR